ncbi:MAG: hypothetical protein HC915_09005 [Anaerolineae bacterium]|nr:hypothetical protein [Anaerolineae bacterium]
MTCSLVHGVCSLCYGRDLGRGDLVSLGAAVGIIAAQSIGEPGTQLTLRTFHTGGTAQATGDITTGLPRVEELFEARKKPKGEAVMVEIGGYLQIDKRDDGVRVARVTRSEVTRDEYELPFGWEIQVEDGDSVREKQLVAVEVGGAGEGQIVARMNGEVHIEGHKLYIRYERVEEREYEIPSSARIRDEIDAAIKESSTGIIEVTPGTQLTDGSQNPHQILRILGEESTQRYLLKEVQDVYRNQGVNISDKHFEVIIRKMLSKVMITRSGDSGILPGELVDKLRLLSINERLLAEGGEPAAGVPVLLGVTKAALSTESFLAASSFQHTIKVLAGAAIEGKEDRLYGLKENVIIGKLIASGTGFHTYHDREIAVPELSLAAQGALDTDTFDEDEDEVDEYDELEIKLSQTIDFGDDSDDDTDDDDTDEEDDTEDEEDAEDEDDTPVEDDDEYYDSMSMAEGEQGLD